MAKNFTLVQDVATKSFTVTQDGVTKSFSINTGVGPAGDSVTVDQTIIDGSTNAVSGNAVFDGLALKAPINNPTFTGIVTAPRITGRCDGIELLCKAGLPINAGQVVYITGASGSNIIIGLAQADSEPTSSKTIGISESTLATNATGYAITEGLMTVSISAPTANEGDPIWLSSTTAGGMVFGLANKPVAPNHIVYLGVVTRKTGNTVVEIYVKIQNGAELDELADVAITNPIAGQALMRGASLWENRSLVASDISDLSTAAVPYTGANANVDLGTYSLTAADGKFDTITDASNSGSPTFTYGIDVAEGQTLNVDYIYDAATPLNYISVLDGKLGAYTGSNIPSLDWINRQLIGSDGSTVATDWSNGIPNFPNGLTSDGEVTGTNIKNHTISDTAPVSPSAGDTWLYSVTGQLFEYYTDVDGSQWIEITGTLGINDYVALSGDQTIAGNKTFSGQTELTGQTAASDTSAMTRALSDARYGRIFGASLTAGVNSDVNTTTYKTVTELSFALDVGNYYIDAILIHNGNASYATSGVKDRIDFTGTATSSGTLYRVLDNATTTLSVPNSLASRVPTIESAPSNRSQTTWRKGVLTVTSAGTLRVQIAQTAAVAGANTTLDTGSQLIIHRIP